MRAENNIKNPMVRYMSRGSGLGGTGSDPGGKGPLMGPPPLIISSYRWFTAIVSRAKFTKLTTPKNNAINVVLKRTTIRVFSG